MTRPATPNGDGQAASDRHGYVDLARESPALPAPHGPIHAAAARTPTLRKLPGGEPRGPSSLAHGPVIACIAFVRPRRGRGSLRANSAPSAATAARAAWIVGQA